MIYKFSDDLNLDYSELNKFIAVGETLTKEELLEKCTGEISFELLQSLKELVLSKIGKTAKGELFLV